MTFKMTALYAWGANSHGQLGLGFVSEQVLEPMRVEDLPDNLCESSIKDIYGGGGHTFLLTNQGKLYGAGWNISGQVGNGTQVRAVPNFESIRGLEDHKVVSVACGWIHSVALTSRGQVWVWGSNSHSQLGLPTNEVPFSSLPICLDISEAVSIAAGLRHTVIATKEGRVYSWGQGQKGQLGHLDTEGKMIKTQTTPRVVEPLEMKVKKVACGQNTTYAITNEGEVLAWGDNKWGQLAHDPVNVSFFTCPLTIPSNYFGGLRAVWMQAGWTHCAVGLSSGQIYMWGRSDYGQVGPVEEEETDEASAQISKTPGKLQNSRYRYVPSCLRLDNIRQVVCGSEHNLAVVGTPEKKKKLMSWGWNEHGNCGTGNTENVYKPVSLSLEGDLKVIGSGSGHSFALVKLL
ncbi:Secretion-regulating guanine nucleotide exchange factor [Armadillidium nasatum]|uniref:Secretion-regulating guanine nucleotide exchange factor n=1 Tax=Armadillidium nasatum TaxID=96803 RepID=A0A5N5SST4_9CRUS|nr:Secretion-regulating guanine nucleotide exchange factor [Armadillidium nasatum]